MDPLDQTQTRTGHIRISGQSFVDIQAILFDKDGTLLVFEPLWLGWLERVLTLLAQQGSPLPTTETLTALGVTPDLKHCLPTGALAIGTLNDVRALLALGLYRHHGLPWNEATQRVYLAAEQALQTIGPEHLAPMPGLLDLLAQARTLGIPLAVVTADDTESARAQLALLGVDNSFAAILGHDAVARGKPFPDMALQACTELGVEPGRTLLFGDSNGDLRMARAAGLAGAIGLHPKGRDSSHLQDADRVITDFTSVIVEAPT